MSAFEADSRQTIHYRVTGKQSIERLDPLISNLSSEALKFVPFGVDLNGEYSSQRMQALLDEASSIKQLFVWETTCEKELRGIHHAAIIRNKLPNSQVLESKASFAFLQQAIPCCRELSTFVAKSGTEVHAWAKRRWDYLAVNSNMSTNDWWVVKASSGNGGRDIWMIHRDNYQSALSDLPEDQEYVVQKYVYKPLLWNTKKFHFRCYAFMQEDGSAWFYEMAFILSAGWEYNTEETADPRRHVTNLSVNKHIAGHPGQVPCHIPSEYPDLYPSMCSLWQETVIAAWPFMRCPTRPLPLNSSHLTTLQPQHFEFCGLDIIADEFGRCWLIEINRLPGLESSKNNKVEEDNMYDRMMLSLLKIILKPILLPSDFIMVEDDQLSMWRKVQESQRSDCEAVIGEEVLLHNMLRWKMFMKKHRAAVMAEMN